jgi:hypothetical protein
MTDTLFELRTEMDMRREALAENQRRIHDALMGLGPYEVTQRQRRLLELLRGCQGRLLSLSIRDITARLEADPRSIKADVRDLVMSFHLPIVSSRDSEDGGYFFAVTAEERISGTADYVKEIIALAQRVRIIRGHHDLSALFGQIFMELPTENERNAA